MSSPDVHPYATLPDDPTTKVQISWIDNRSGATGASQNISSDRFDEDVEGAEIFGSGAYLYHFAAGGLIPGETLAVEIRESGTLIKSFSVKTFPAKLPDGGMRFCLISDVHIDNSGALPNSSDIRHVANEQPEALLLPGDVVSYADVEITSTNTAHWIRWFAEYIGRFNDAKGHLVPILATVGNHEVGNHTFDGATGSVNPGATYFQFFHENPVNLDPVGENYGSVKIGDYVQFLVLDTHSAFAADVGSWMSSAIDPSMPLVIPFYHAPLFRGGARQDGNGAGGQDMGETFMANLRNAYAPIWHSAGNVKAVFSGHVHVHKRSVPWTISASDPGGDRFVLSNGSYLHKQVGGIVEYGDGNRHNRVLWSTAPWWLDYANRAEKQYYLLTITHESFDVVTKFTSNGSTVDSASYAIDVPVGTMVLRPQATGDMVLYPQRYLDGPAEPVGPPTTAPIVTLTPASQTALSLSLSEVTGVTGYRYRVGTSGSWIDLGSSRTAQITGLSPGTSYTVQARAYNAAGDGPIGAATASTLGPDVNAPPVFQTSPPTSVRAGQTYMYNGVVTDADGDLITITLEEGPNWLELTDHGDGTFTLEGIAPNE